VRARCAPCFVRSDWKKEKKGHVEHVTATISSCQPERSTRLQETDVRPSPAPKPKGKQVAGITRETESPGRGRPPLGRAGGCRPVRPGPGRTRQSRRSPWMDADADADAVAVAWTPSKMRAEASWPGLPRGKSYSEVAQRHGSGSAPAPGRQVGLGRSLVRLRPRQQVAGQRLVGPGP